MEAAGPKFDWRNKFDIDPLKSCDGFSYQQAMIAPIAGALEDAVAEETRVEFALAGEMGRSLFAYPGSYRKMMTKLRQRGRPKHLAVGLSLNYNEISGAHSASDKERKALNQLLAESDFLGFSCYGPVSVPPEAGDFAAMVKSFVAEVEENEVVIPGNLDLHFSEVGHGGVSASGQAGKVEQRVGAQRGIHGGIRKGETGHYTFGLMLNFQPHDRQG
jgi:hypothetical protein